jgi:predicted nucleic-acid-binding protein
MPILTFSSNKHCNISTVGRSTYGVNMRAVDTNVLVRLVAGDDFKQTAAAEKFVSPGAWVSHLVLAETIWVLATVYDRDPLALAQTVDFLLKHRDLTIQDAEVVVAALVHYRNRPSPGFSNCLVLEIARKAGHVPMGTFDRTLAKLDGAERIAA